MYPCFAMLFEVTFLSHTLFWSLFFLGEGDCFPSSPWQNQHFLFTWSWKNVFEQHLSTMVLSPCRSLIQVAIILVFESVRLQPSFRQSGSMFKEQCLENPTFSWRFTFHLQRFCIIYLNPQAVIMPFLRCCTKGHTLETKILIGKFGTSWRICPYAATTRSVYRWWLPSGVIFLRFILISIVRRSRLKTTFQSCVEIATMMSQKFLVFFLLCAALLCSLRIFIWDATPCAHRLELRFVGVLISPSVLDSKPCPPRTLSRQLLGFPGGTTEYVKGFWFSTIVISILKALCVQYASTHSLPLFSASIARLCLQIMHSHRRRHALCSPSTSCD